jgi:hypothetical protein
LELDTVLGLLEESFHVKKFIAAEYEQLTHKLILAKERKCSEFKLTRRGEWIGYTTPRGVYQSETGLCLVPKC